MAVKRTRILKRHVGRPVDFRACNSAAGVVLNGCIEKVCNGIATVRYWAVPGLDGAPATCSAEGFIALLEVRSPRLVAIY
jgi:hypothetical protein